MSRIGKRPVAAARGRDAPPTEGQTLSVKGPKGTLTMQMRDEIATRSATTASSSSRPTTTKQARAFWGMQRTLVQNLVTGVTEGFTKVLEITGVGYRAAGPGPETSGCSSATATTSTSRSRKASRSRLPTKHGRDQRHRQAAGRPGRGRDPPLAQARAVQGQGHQVPRRVYLPQRRQEEVSHGETLPLRPPPPPRPHRASRARASGKPRLSVHRSGRHIYAQVIDDAAGKTMAAASTLERNSRARPARPRDGAAAVGKTVAERAKKAGVTRSCSIAAASCSMAG